MTLKLPVSWQRSMRREHIRVCFLYILEQTASVKEVEV